MKTRLSRVEQTGHNRERVLTAARRVFLAKGYGGASLESIAEEAGFSKGVVYSQFDSKADLFLALLERRIGERAAENERAAAATRGPDGLSALIALAERADASDPAWSILVIEFRVHAARDPVLRKRYAEAHARTLERLAGTLSKMMPAAGTTDARSLAEIVLALGTGIALERSVSPDAVPTAIVERLLRAALENGAAQTPRRSGRGRS